LDASLGHALEALCVGLVHLWNLEAVLLKLVDQLGRIELAVASSGLDNLCLLLQREVLPGEIWTDVLLEEGKDFVVRDGTGVGEVVNSSLLVLGKKDGGWEQVVEEGVRVRNINDTLVLGDLGDEVAAVKVVAHGHSQSQDEHVRVGFHDLFDVGLRLRVEGAIKVGLVGLEIAWAADGVLLVVCVDASGGENRQVDFLKETAIGQVQGANDIASDGLLLVVLAPIDIGATCAASTVENVSWLDSLELGNDSLTVLHANSGGSNGFALALEEGLEMTGNPSLASPDEVGEGLIG